MSTKKPLEKPIIMNPSPYLQIQLIPLISLWCTNSICELSCETIWIEMLFFIPFVSYDVSIARLKGKLNGIVRVVHVIEEQSLVTHNNTHLHEMKTMMVIVCTCTCTWSTTCIFVQNDWSKLIGTKIIQRYSQWSPLKCLHWSWSGRTGCHKALLEVLSVCRYY